MAIYYSPDKKGINQRKNTRLIHKVCCGNIKIRDGKYDCDRCNKIIKKEDVKW